MCRYWSSVGVLAIAFSLTVVAQDTRTVVEPKIPTFCAKLDARLTSANGGLAPADESKLDTERIQKAIEGCEVVKASRCKCNGLRMRS